MINDNIYEKKLFLGVEFGSTRIKATAINDAFEPVSSGGYIWKSKLENGIWTYELNEAWEGFKAALSTVEDRDSIVCLGISGMMHGYLAFDKDWKLLVPFRTWQNTVTREASEKLTELFGFNIPQRWSIAHLYQACLNSEEHISRVAHITTLAGYIHYMLTGVNAVGVGEASGIFPIDPLVCDYDGEMLEKFRINCSESLKYDIKDILPKVLKAGEVAGFVTEDGEKLLGGLLKAGLRMAPCEGDAGTGMVATNSVAAKTGNVSAGTSVFAMAVLEKPLKKVYPEIDIVSTPDGKPTAMVHCNNCTNDMNAWVDLIKEAAELFGGDAPEGELYRRLYQNSLEGDTDCGGVVVCNYLAGESVTGLDSGMPFAARKSGSSFTLANFIKANLYSTIASLAIGMKLLYAENVEIDALTAHGGLFKTPIVGQSYLSNALGVSVTCNESAGEGGSYGMALLAAFACDESKSLEVFLARKVFCDCKSVTLAPDEEGVKGFNRYLSDFSKLLYAERAAVEAFREEL